MSEKQYSLVYYADKGGAFIKNNETGTEWYHDSRASLLEIVNKLNGLAEENEQLKKELKRCKDWINSDKNDYELTLSFIKNKGYSLKDVLEYEKELKSE